MDQELMEVAVTELEPMPAKPPTRRPDFFALAVRLPPNWGQAMIALAILICGFVFTALVLLAPGDDYVDQSGVIEAQKDHIASLERANDQLATLASQTNASLAKANEEMAYLASATITGLNAKDFISFASILLIVLGVCLLLSFKIPLQVAGLFPAAVGIILLVAGGS